MSRVLVSKDFLAGSLYMAFGLLGLWLGRSLEIGTASAMEAGYFPRLVCTLLVALGAALAVISLLRPGEAPERGTWRPFVFVTLSCLAFALLLQPLGLVLPGIGPLTTMAMILPVTFWIPPVGALIMLAGVFYGAQYGGSTTAILVKIPGETSSVITILDGYAMAQRGRAGPALAIAALGSLFAGSVVTLLIAVGGPPLASIALLFQSADYVSVMLLGLVSAVVLAHGSVLKAVGMIVLGVLFGVVGTDVMTGEYRLAMGLDVLFDGIGFVPLSMGLFGLAEIMVNLESTDTTHMSPKPVSA